VKVDVQRIGCDFLAFSGHKMCAPTGCGVLYIKQELFDKVEPSYIGGGTITDVDIDEYTLDKGPARFEAGTPAIAEAIGLGAAIEYLSKIGIENIENHEKELSKQMLRGLEQIPNVLIYGPKHENRIALLCFNVEGLHPQELALALEKPARIMVRAGHHCALPLIKSIADKTGTARASAYVYSTREEIETLVQATEQIARTHK
jgi:cysteine desulfurase/selenocysteine lyase